MERKVGEVFEHEGEWYQCVEYRHLVYKPDIDAIRDIPCFSCYFSHKKALCGSNALVGECHPLRRRDRREVCFKKLKKVGESFNARYNGRELIIQKYKLENRNAILPDYHWITFDSDSGGWVINVEIKQNQGDMEEKKLNLKPFNLEAVRNGKPVCTRDGRKARIVCFDIKGSITPIIALIADEDGDESAYLFHKDGRAYDDRDNDSDLMMLPEKHEGWINVYKERIYNTKEEAIAHKAPGTKYIDTIKVELKE